MTWQRALGVILGEMSAQKLAASMGLSIQTIRKWTEWSHGHLSYSWRPPARSRVALIARAIALITQKKRRRRRKPNRRRIEK